MRPLTVVAYQHSILKKSRAPVVLQIETLTGGILEVYNF